MRKLILALLVSSACYMVHAQNDFVTRMNEIKMSGEYYTAHNRADTEEAAFEKCVKDIMMQLPPGIYDEAFVRKNAMRLTKPGGPCRVFAYLKKGTAPQKKEEMSQIVFKRDLQLEEAEDSHEIKPRPDTPKPIAPKPEIKKAPTANADKSLLTRIVNDIQSRPTINNAYNSFNAKKDLGMVSAFGLLNSVSNTDNVYIVIYDATTQELISILSPIQNGSRKNLITDTQDSFSNYHGVNAFWFTLE